MNLDTNSRKALTDHLRKIKVSDNFCETFRFSVSNQQIELSFLGSPKEAILTNDLIEKRLITSATLLEIATEDRHLQRIVIDKYGDYYDLVIEYRSGTLGYSDSYFLERKEYRLFLKGIIAKKPNWRKEGL